MLTICITSDQGLEKIHKIANGAWVYVVDPTPEEMENYKDKNWSIYSQAQKEGKVIYDRKIK